MKAEELRTKAFLALYHRSMSDGIRNYSLLDVTRFSGTPMQMGVDRLIVETLAANGWVTVHKAKDFDDEERGYVAITWAGIEAAEKMLEDMHEASDWVPAADRYVTLTDNQQAEFATELGILKEAVRGSNDSSEEDKELALYEIAVFEASIVSPIAAADLIQRFVDRVLMWVTTVFTAAVVAEVAQRLVKALLSLIG